MLLRLDKYQRISTYSSLLHSCSLFRSSITPRSSHVFRTGFALSFPLTSRIEELVQFGLSNDRKHLNEAVYLSLGGGGEGEAVIQNPRGRSQNKSFSDPRASLWSENKGGRPPGAIPWIRPTEIMVHSPMFTQV